MCKLTRSKLKLSSVLSVPVSGTTAYCDYSRLSLVQYRYILNLLKIDYGSTVETRFLQLPVDRDSKMSEEVNEENPSTE